MFVFQGRFIFPRQIVEYANLEQVLAKPEFAKYELQVADGITLKGLVAKSAKKNAPLLLAFAGNGHDAICFVKFLRDIYGPDYQVVGFNYRGYGLPEYRSDGAPSQQNILHDALVIYDKVVADLQPSEVYIIGFSLGSSVGAYVLSERDAKAMIMITPFDEMSRVVKNHHVYLPVNLLLKHPFPTVEFVAAHNKPIAILATDADEVVPAKNLARLRTFIPNICYDITLHGTTHSGLLEHKDFAQNMRKALAACQK